MSIPGYKKNSAYAAMSRYLGSLSGTDKPDHFEKVMSLWQELGQSLEELDPGDPVADAAWRAAGLPVDKDESAGDKTLRHAAGLE